jgi:glycosyltransferase involved in cell wall biosynthesis
MHVLWLASWYPDPYEKKNGDFIQRHAKAVAKFLPIDVIHIVQTGYKVTTKRGSIHTKEDNLRELIYSFNYTPWGIKWIDKIRYNLKYRFFYNDLLDKYSKQYGIPEMIHIHAPMKAGVVAGRIAKHWHVPYIVTDHSSMYDKKAIDSFYTRSNYFKKHLRKLYKKADAVTNVSEVMADKIQQLFAIKNIEIVRNVVDTSCFFYQPTIGSNIFRWVHVSTLYPLKNAEKIIEAFEQLHKKRNDWQLVIVGENNAALKRLVKAKNLQQKVLFTGELDYADVAKQMQQSSALVMFSKYENFPCTIIEALCCGLPVIASNVGGIKEAINISNGILVESENVAALQNALENMMNAYPQYNQSQIANEATAKYNEDVIGYQFIQLYRKILD